MGAPALVERSPLGEQAAALPTTVSFSEALVESLHALGVERAFGLVGGAIAPLAHALAVGPLKVHHFRHEGGAGFAALEASLASNRPTAVFTTTGPGLTNALTPLWAARWEGAKIVLISGATSAPQRGRWACQETSAYTFPVGALHGPGALFHFGATLESADELAQVQARLAAGFARPEGFVAHLGLPLGVQAARVATARRPSPIPPVLPSAGPAALRGIAQLLAGGDAVIWAGYGARHASAELLALATRLRLPVMCSPRAKGVFPEDHPLYLGSTGLGGQSSVDAYFRRRKVEHVLVLGTRLSEPTSFWNPALVPSEAFIHVDLDPTVPGNAYPEARTVAIQAEVGGFLRGLLDALGEEDLPSTRRVDALPAAEQVTNTAEGPVRPQRVMQAIQKLIIDRTDAVVMSESGNSFAWANQLLRFPSTGRYRVSTGFGSMGHMTAGVVGTALARGGLAVAVVGDGSMLMQAEVNTAVQYGARALWIVLNDAQYGMVEQGMRALGLTPLETGMPRTDFATWAQAQGATGLKVDREDELDAVLERALKVEGPCVVDVRIDARQTAPWMRRIQNLIAQGADTAPGDNR